MTIEKHIIDRGDGAAVELFVARPSRERTGAILLVHGNQGGHRLGASEAVGDGTLLRFSSRLQVTTAAVSQPGFGGSDGPADFCGPLTQKAIVAAIDFLAEQAEVDPDRIILYGNSRGAVACAMVAAQVPRLRAVVLASGVYELSQVYREGSEGIRRAIEAEAGRSPEPFHHRSAIHHAYKIRADVLLLHGRHDDRAPLDQAVAFSQALAEGGTNVSFHILDCGHRLPRAATAACT